MAKAKRLPSGSWRVLLYTGMDENTGKRTYESITADTKAEVELLAAKRKSDIEKGIQKKKCPTTMTVGEAVDLYIDEREEFSSPKTIREYRGYKRLYLQKLMNIKVANLTEQQIQKEINRESRRLSPKSIYNIWGLLRAALNSINPDVHYQIKLPQKEHKEMHIPTNDQLLELFDYVKGKRIEIPVLLAATCGMRRGEIAALDLKRDIDFSNGKISITKAMANTSDGEWVIKAPKTTGSKRTITAPTWVLEVLELAKNNGYKNMNPAHITSAFARICDKLEIDIRFHDLRHPYVKHTTKIFSLRLRFFKRSRFLMLCEKLVELFNSLFLMNKTVCRNRPFCSYAIFLISC